MQSFFLIDRAAGELDAQLLSSQTAGTFTFGNLTNLGSQDFNMPAEQKAVLTIEDEQILISAMSETAGTVTATIEQRGYNGTSAATHDPATPVRLTANSAWLNNLQDTAAADDAAVLGALVYQPTVTTIVSATSHTIAGDQTAIFTVGRVYAFKRSGVWYQAAILAANFATGTTTLTLVGDGLPASGTVTECGFAFNQPLGAGPLSIQTLKEIAGNIPQSNAPAGRLWIWSKNGGIWTMDSSGNIRTAATAVAAVSSSAGALTLMPALANVFELVLTENVTSVSLGSAGGDGQEYVLRVKQGAGAFGVTFGSAFRFSGDFPSYSPSSVNGTVDYVHFRYNADAGKYDIFAIFKGNAASPVPNTPDTPTLRSTLTTSEAVQSGDLLAWTGADAVGRYSILNLPSTFDQSTVPNTTTAYDETCRMVRFGLAASGIGYFTYSEDNGGGTTTANVIRIPFTANTGALGTVTGPGTAINGLSNPDTIDNVPMTSGRVLFAGAASNSFRACIGDLTSGASFGTAVNVDTSNVADGYCEYISDSHVLFFARNTSGASIDFYKYTASGTALSSSSTGTVATLTGKTFKLKGVRRFPGTNYFLFLVQNDTDGTGQGFVALYDTGTSTFSSVGSIVNFPGSVQFQNYAGGNALFAPLNDTQMMAAFPTSVTANSIALFTRSGVTLTVGTIHAAGTGGANNAGLCLSNLNDVRTAAFGTMQGTQAVVQVWELAPGGTDIQVRVSGGFSQAPGNGTMQSNGMAVPFYCSPVRLGFGTCITSGTDVAVGTGLLLLPAPVGIAEGDAAAMASVVADTAGYNATVSGLTAAVKQYAGFSGLLTSDSSGGPDKIGTSKDTNEIILRSW